MTEKVLDFVEKRKHNIEQKRRNFERILFRNFLGAYSVLDNQGTNYPVQLVDVSHDGCLFQIPYNPTKDTPYETDHELTLRMYFTQDSFVPVILKVKRFQEYIDKSGNVHARYGCEFDKSTASFSAVESFINFLYSFAEHSSVDKGDQRVFFL
ncbi:MAG: PilZ domain-containing protein [Bacteriovoracaceae bacterium]